MSHSKLELSGTPRLINSDCGRQASIRGRTNLIECETRGGFHTSFGRGWPLHPMIRKNAGLCPCWNFFFVSFLSAAKNPGSYLARYFHGRGGRA